MHSTREPIHSAGPQDEFYLPLWVHHSADLRFGTRHSGATVWQDSSKLPIATVTAGIVRAKERTGIDVMGTALPATGTFKANQFASRRAR